MKKILTLLLIAFMGFSTVLGQAPAPWSGTIDGINYTGIAKMPPIPPVCTATVKGIADKANTEITIPATVTPTNINGAPQMPYSVTKIATGAFKGLTASEVVVNLPATATPLTLESTYAETFGNNVKVYAPNSDIQTAYNEVAAWNNNVLLLGDGGNPHGECGTNLTWEYNPSTNILTIEGTGDMENYDFVAYGVVGTPWKDYQSLISSIVLPEGLTHIGNCAFYGSVITTLSLPSTLTTIGDHAFTNTQMLTSTVDIPASVTSIGTAAFTNSNANINFLGTNSPAFPEDEHVFGDGKTITVPNGCLNAYRAALGTDAANYDFPASCGENLEWYANGPQASMWITSPDTLIIQGSGRMADFPLGDYNQSTTPWYILYNDVSGIGDEGSRYVKLPAGITYIGQNAFKNSDGASASKVMYCDALTAPELHADALHKGWETLYIRAEADAASYSSWSKYFNSIEVLHATGTCGDMFIWDYNPNNHSLTIEVNPVYAELINDLPAEYFIMPDYTAENPAPWNEYASAIQTLVLPSYLYNIGNYAFYGCSALTNVTIPASVKTIGDHAFDGCTSMASLEIEGEVEAIGEGAIAEEAQIVMDDNAAVGLGDDNAATIETTLETLLATTESKVNEEDKKINMTIKREIQRNGHFNTICLPFDLNAEQIEASSLNGAEIFEFSDAQLNDGELHLDFKKVTSTVAGTPYLFRYNVNEPNMMELNFKGVIISELTAGTSRDFGSVTLRGTLKEPVELSAQSEGNIALLFLGANDTFFWPTTTKTVNPFRAYFTTGTPLLGAPARIRTQGNVATDLESVINSSEGVQKLLENGQIIILRNGIRYNIAGQAL